MSETKTKSLFKQDTPWQRFKLKYFGAKPWSGPGAVKGATPAALPDASFYEGTGKVAVLLIHGLTGTPTEMRFIGKGLVKAGFTVYGMQLDGHCGSEEDLVKTGWTDWYASVERAYGELAAKHEVVFVAGLSMGSLMALHLAASHPGKIRGLGVLSATLKYDGWSIPKLSFLLPLFLNTPLGLHYRFVENYPYGIKDERLRQRVVANMLAGNSAEAGNLGMTGSSLRQLLTFVEVVKAEMPRIETPTLIVHATHDDVASRRNADYIEAHLGGPKKKVMLDDSYHMITVDKQRGEVVAELVRYFTDLVGPEALASRTPATADAG
jgi:carboxylesterase